MKKRKVGIIDYGVGNLRSVANAVNEVGAEPLVSNNKHLLSEMDCLILPGVGAFKHGMDSLHKEKIVDFIYEVKKRNIPLLGICLGMQLMSTLSYEFGKNKGLNLIPGEVKRISSNTNQKIRLPNVGWFPLEINSHKNELVNAMIKDTRKNDKFYFIHSYSVTHNDFVVASSRILPGVLVSSITARDKIVGLQFHPEKSGPAGLTLLKNFINFQNSNLK